MTIAPINLDPTSAARAAGVSRSRMFALIASGEIDSFKVGSARLVPVQAIYDWTARMVCQSRAATSSNPRDT